MNARYEAYINGPEWAARRARYFSRDGAKMRRAYQCSGCKLRPKDRAGLVIHLHHLSYEHLGDEPDRDLTPLCERCHELVHALHDTGRFASLRQATTFFKVQQREGRKDARRHHRPWRGLVFVRRENVFPLEARRRP